MPPQLLVCLTCAALATSLDYATLHSTIRSAHLESWLRPAPAGSNAASGDRIAGAFEAEAERFIGGAKDWIQPGSSEKPFSFTGLHIRQRISQLLLNSTVLPTNMTRRSLRGRSIMRNQSDSANQTTAAGAVNITGAVSAVSSVQRSGSDAFLDGVFESVLEQQSILPQTFFAKSRNCSAGVTLMSGSNRNTAFIDDTVENHKLFARRHCHDYWWHNGNMAKPRQPYWNKIAMLRHAMLQQPHQKAFVWVDDDVVFTNITQDNFVRVLREHPHESLIVTRDAARKVASLNTGIIIVRNDEQAKDLLDEVWHRGLSGGRGGVSLAFASQDHCLHEQEALQELFLEGRAGIRVLDQRAQHEHGVNLNTFLRWSHYNSRRQLHQRFPDDLPGSKWRHGDFTGHCSGMSAVRRAICVASLLSSAVDGH